MKLFVGLEIFEPNDTNRLVSDERVAGIVAGDLLCQKRMYDSGNIGFAHSLYSIVESGKTVVYQTPLYSTSRNIEAVLETLRFIDHNTSTGAVIVQDVGIASAIRDDYPQMIQIWGKLGRSRGYGFNEEVYAFFYENNITHIEAPSLPILHAAAKNGIKPIFVYGDTEYQTLGRQCYYCYLLGLSKENCKRKCLSKNIRLRTAGPVDTGECFRGQELSVDGYMLGKNIRYSMENASKKEMSLCSNTSFVYAERYAQLVERMDEIVTAFEYD